MFIGQEKLWIRLEYLIDKMKKDNVNMNLLFRAPSGYGKTKMAIMVGLEVEEERNIQYELPDYNGEVYIDESKRIVIIDEVHTLKYPENLYPHLDSRKQSFFLCSNEFGEVKEPLINRCIPFIFDDYSQGEIDAIVEHYLELKLPPEYIEEIGKNCQLNPRIAKDIITRQLNYIFEKRQPNSLEDLRDIITNVLQIENGLTIEQRRYLDYLKKVERASIDSISYSIHVDKSTIQKEIEPYLIRQNLIRITSRGRFLCS